MLSSFKNYKKLTPNIVESKPIPSTVKSEHPLVLPLSQLYTNAKEKLRQSIEKYKTTHSPTSPESLTFTYNSFDSWLTELATPGREYKILQFGGLIPQPTGGWVNETPTQEHFIKQLTTLLDGDTKFVICTEAPSETFFGQTGLVYKRPDPTKPVGVLSKAAFTLTLENLPLLEGFPTYVCFTLTSDGNSIKILNLHGSSGKSSAKPAQLQRVLEICREHNVNAVTGDLNITVTKTDPPQPLRDVLENLQVTCVSQSERIIHKKRAPDDIITNNQLTKGGKSVSEVDSMVIIELSECPQETQENATEMVAFSDYSPTNPIIADHAVITRKVGLFTLCSVNTASVDDEVKGFLLKGPWKGVDPALFATEVSLPYTKWWVPECKKVLDRLTPEQKEHPEMKAVFEWITNYMRRSGGRTRRTHLKKKDSRRVYGRKIKVASQSKKVLHVHRKHRRPTIRSVRSLDSYR